MVEYYRMEAQISEWILVGIMAAIWLVVFAIKKEVRKELLIVGLLSLLLLPIGFTYFAGSTGDLGSLRLVDGLFGIFAAGLSATLFHVVFGKHYDVLPIRRPESALDTLTTQSWLLRLFSYVLGYTWIVIVLQFVFKDQPGIAFLAGTGIVALYVIAHRADLFIDALVSSLLMTTLVFLAVLIASQFEGATTAISGPSIIGVPVSVLLWAFGIGLVLGPAYEYIRRLTISPYANR